VVQQRLRRRKPVEGELSEATTDDEGEIKRLMDELLQKKTELSEFEDMEARKEREKRMSWSAEAPVEQKDDVKRISFQIETRRQKLAQQPISPADTEVGGYEAGEHNQPARSAAFPTLKISDLNKKERMCRILLCK